MTLLERHDLEDTRRTKPTIFRVMMNKRGCLIGKLGDRSRSRMAGSDGSDGSDNRRRRVSPSDSLP
jgi:hypothetical protein